MTATAITLGLEATIFSSSSEVTLTSGVGVKGSWVALETSSAMQGNWLMLIMLDPSTTTDYDVDIGTGAMGSEVVLIPDIHYHINLTGNSQISLPFNFKINIPIGTRISARVENAAAETIAVELILCGV